MGDNQVTTTGTTAPSNPNVTKTLNELLGGVQDAWRTGPSVFGESLYGGVGDETQESWRSAMTAARNPAYSSAVGSGMNYASNLIGRGGLTGGLRPGQHSDIQYSPQPGSTEVSPQPPGGHSTPMVPSAEMTANGFVMPSNNGTPLPPGYGNGEGGQLGDLAQTRNLSSQYGELGSAYGGNTPGISALRGKLQDDTLTGVNSIFGGSGRLGSGNHMSSASEGLGNALAGFDYGNYQNDVNNRYRSLDSQAGQANTAFGMEQQGVNNAMGATAALPGIYQSSLLPSQTMGAVGASKDAAHQASLLGRNDLFNRQRDAKTDLLAKLSSILSGTAGAGGTTTTQTQPGTPWWQTGLSLLGQFI